MKEKYTTLLNCLKQHQDLQIGEIDKLISILDGRSFASELEEKYGLVTDHSKFWNRDYINLNTYIGIFKYGESTRRSISWSDNDTQPGDEYLYAIQFSTGAYIFGEDYPQDIFNKFFVELKSYNPDFSDSHNHGLYWKLENAQKINDKFSEILKKYNELNKEDAKRRKVENLKKEIEKLTA